MVSSMAPTIAVDSKTGRPVLSIGGAGGTRITSGILQGKNHNFRSNRKYKFSDS